MLPNVIFESKYYLKEEREKKRTYLVAILDYFIKKVDFEG